jgi:hypothetical protein
LTICSIPTRGNLFLPVRLLVWADGRGTVEQADTAARAELQGAPKQKLLQLKIYKNTIGSSTGRCLFVVQMSALICNCFGCEPVSPGFILPFCRFRPVQADAGLPAWSSGEGVISSAFPPDVDCGVLRLRVVHCVQVIISDNF